jgi:hypothetical protein
MATGEYTMLAKLLEPAETVRAMVVATAARWWRPRSAWVIAATDRRLLLLSKAMLTRRERVEEIDLDRVRGARSDPPLGFVLQLDDGERVFSFAGPPPQVAALVSLARGDASGERFDELSALARRKLGRVLAFGIETELLVLADELDEDEPALDLAYASDAPPTLLAVCPRRLVLVGAQGLRNRTPAGSIAYSDVADATHDGEDLVVALATGDEHRAFRNLLPAGAAAIIAGRISARTGPRSH